MLRLAWVSHISRLKAKVKFITLKVLAMLVSFSKNFGVMIGLDTLPKAQRTQGIENFDSFNTFSSKQKLQQALKS